MAVCQAPAIQWKKNIGGSGNDTDLKVIQNYLGDVFIAGNTTSSSSFDVPANNGGSDIFVAKVNSSNGSLIWKKNYGGSANDYLAGLDACSDGGVILLCHSGSTSGPLNQVGVWLVKINNDGSEAFKVFRGGNPKDGGNIIQTQDGGFAFVSTKSVTGNGLDLWVVKTNSAGAQTWQKTIGGTGEEYAADIIEDSGNFYVLGGSFSPSVNSQNNHQSGTSDLLSFKLDNAGNTIWTRLFGGTKEEIPASIVKGEGAEIILLGSTNSIDGNIFFGYGGYDAWICNVDSDTGFLNTNSSTGGTKDDFSSGMYFDALDSSPIITATIYSDSVGNQAVTNSPNILVTELVPFGGESWVLSLGGTNLDSAMAIIGTVDGGYLVAGHSYSNNGDIPNNYGGADFYLAKLNFPCPTELVLGAANFRGSISRTSDSFIKTSSVFEAPPSKVKLTSGYILMEPGFEVKSGVVFETEIGGCP